MSEQTKLSEVETELYDRQIRLWGVESQEKLRAADVLLIGIGGVGSEVAKNILLSGINSLTILDDGTVTERDYACNFLLHRESIGKMIAEEVLIKAQALNPLVKITADTDSPSSKDLKFFENFTCIVATNIKTDLMLKIDKVCTSNGIKFICGDVFGMFGYSVSNLNKHIYHEDRALLSGKKRTLDGDEKTVKKITHTIEYPELKKVLILPNTKQSVDHIRKRRIRNELFYLMLALLEFRNNRNRNPDIASKAEDLEYLEGVMAEVCQLYAVDESKVNKANYELIFGEVAPVCAVLGGIIAQEVIKAVSGKEVPINNVFLFDPITYTGKEETITV